MFKKIAIVGEGKMGTSLFWYLNDFNFDLVWLVSSEEEKNKLMASYQKKTKRFFDNGIIDEPTFTLKLKNTIITDNPEDLRNCDLIIESIWENLDAKKELLLKLDEIIKPDCIFTSNSSSINPSILIPSEKRKEKFAGLHFFFPVNLKNIAEIIYSDFSSKKTIEQLQEFLKEINRFCLLLPEKHSFILNKLFLSFQAGAYNLAIKEKLSFGNMDSLIRKQIFPIGVFEFFDQVGIDVMHQSVVNYTEQAEDKDFYKPLINALVDLKSKNRLGIKTKAGFYDYTVNSAILSELSSQIENESAIVNNLKMLLSNSASIIIEKGVCTPDVLAYAVKEYMALDELPFMIPGL
jgi:3-hydroxybutyryl-CoA dehydrogenase